MSENPTIYNRALNSEIAEIAKSNSQQFNSKNSNEINLLNDYDRLIIPLIYSDGQLAWPERFSAEMIDKLRNRVGEKKFLAQMQLQPINLSQAYFDINSLQFYCAKNNTSSATASQQQNNSNNNVNSNININSNAQEQGANKNNTAADFAAGITYTENNFIPSYSVNGTKVNKANAYWDPSSATTSSDNSVLTIGYKSEDGTFYIEKIHYINSERNKNNLNNGNYKNNKNDNKTEKFPKVEVLERIETGGVLAQIQQVLKLLKQFYIPILHIETNGIGKFIPELARKEIAAQKLQITVSEIHNSTKKSTRIIEALEGLISAKLIYFNSEILKTNFANEIKTWSPENKNMHDDGLDSLAGLLLTTFGALRYSRQNNNLNIPSIENGTSVWVSPQTEATKPNGIKTIRLSKKRIISQNIKVF